MATTTPNFGWSVPTSTDLVKDGATAIETLGDSIDASMADLKGGTTGQILSKTSGTDMDFTWVAPTTGDITGVSVTSPITGGGTSGDVTIGISSSAIVPSQTGNSGKYLTTDGTSSSWATLAGGGMTLLSTTTLSGTSTTISSINQTYVNLLAFIVADRPAAAAGLYITHNGNSSNYSRWGNQQGSNFGGAAETTFLGAYSATSTTNDSNFTQIIFPYYSATNNRKMAIMNRSFLVNAGDRNNIDQMGFYYGDTAAITSLKFEFTGSSFSGGTVYLYGVK